MQPPRSSVRRAIANCATELRRFFDSLLRECHQVGFGVSALPDGADAKQLQELLAAQGIELDEKDIAKVSSGIIAKIANDTDASPPLSDEDLEAVAGGGLVWLGNGRECKG